MQEMPGRGLTTDSYGLDADKNQAAFRRWFCCRRTAEAMRIWRSILRNRSR